MENKRKHGLPDAAMDIPWTTEKPMRTDEVREVGSKNDPTLWLVPPSPTEPGIPLTAERETPPVTNEKKSAAKAFPNPPTSGQQRQSPTSGARKSGKAKPTLKYRAPQPLAGGNEGFGGDISSQFGEIA